MTKRNNRNNNGKSNVKSSNNGKGRYNKKGPSKGNDQKGMSTDMASQQTTSVGRNDPDWYSAYPFLIDASARIPFTYAVGTPVDLRNSNYDVAPNGDYYSIPGLATIEVVPGPGISTDYNSAVNMAARNLFSFVRHANSGSANYDAQDIMMYVLAADEIFMMFEWLKKVYGILGMTNLQSRYLPKAIIEALGFDYEDLVTNKTQFYDIINRLVIPPAQLAIPGDMAYYKRHDWIYSSIYVDEQVAKAQMYTFVPKGFRMYDETVSTGSRLKFYGLSRWHNDAGKLDIQSIKEMVLEITNSFLRSSDTAMISGDVSKAYGVENLRKLSAMSQDYTTPLIYNEVVLNQIQNATILEVNSDSGNLDINQDPSINQGTIEYAPQVVIRASQNKFNNPLYGNRIINGLFNEMQPMDIVEATRFTVAVEQIGADEAVANIQSCGTELVTGVKYWTFAIKRTTNAINMHGHEAWYASNVYETSTSNANQWNKLLGLAYSTKFRYHPMEILWTEGIEVTGDTYPYFVNGVNQCYFYDIGNYSVVQPEILNQIHDAVTLSLFYAPSTSLRITQGN